MSQREKEFLTSSPGIYPSTLCGFFPRLILGLLFFFSISISSSCVKQVLLLPSSSSSVLPSLPPLPECSRHYLPRSLRHPSSTPFFFLSSSLPRPFHLLFLPQSSSSRLLFLNPSISSSSNQVFLSSFASSVLSSLPVPATYSDSSLPSLGYHHYLPGHFGSIVLLVTKITFSPQVAREHKPVQMVVNW